MIDAFQQAESAFTPSACAEGDSTSVGDLQATARGARHGGRRIRGAQAGLTSSRRSAGGGDREAGVVSLITPE